MLWNCSGTVRRSQDSILGPLLFIIYRNDFNYISNLLKIVMFADDTNLFLTGKDCLEIESLFNRELRCISEWFTSNRLSLMFPKHYTFVFSNKKNIQLKLSIAVLIWQNKWILNF